jgi:creatinine amidohydrolase/Fe(II)-dependent formamide hydrolase-like protein
MAQIFFGELTSEEADKISSQNSLILIPIGSIEQHGQHLPLATDSIISQEVTRLVAERINHEFPVLIFPQILFGKSTEHTSKPGTISLETEVLVNLLRNICRNLAKNGFKKIVFINGHGGNSNLLNTMLREIREETGAFVASIYLYSEKLLKEALDRFKLEELDVFHACTLETSFMMVIKPELVHMEKASKEKPHKFTEESSYKYLKLTGSKGIEFSWLIDDISESGVIGDPTKATQEIGKEVLKVLIEKICEVLREIKRV